jgi:peptide/nickel transport system permease protein
MTSVIMVSPSPRAEPKITSRRQAALAAFWKGFKRLLSNPMAVVGIVIICLLLLVAAFAPLIAPYNPFEQNLSNSLRPPSATHWFGTDEYGRDIFSRIVYGTRITLYIIFLATITVSPIGLVVGTVAGYLGGWVDTVLMRITDIFLSLPGLVLALAFVAVLGPSLDHAILAIALTNWPNIARLARAETLSVRGADYIAVMKLQGASPLRIIFKHIVPMCLPSLIIRSTLNMAGIVLTAAALGFLGLGAQSPLPEWGAMTSSGRKYMLDSWWLVTMPGLAIVTVSLAFNFLGDGLRDVLDTRKS